MNLDFLWTFLLSLRTKPKPTCFQTGLSANLSTSFTRIMSDSDIALQATLQRENSHREIDNLKNSVFKLTSSWSAFFVLIAIVVSCWHPNLRLPGVMYWLSCFSYPASF